MCVCMRAYFFVVHYHSLASPVCRNGAAIANEECQMKKDRDTVVVECAKSAIIRTVSASCWFSFKIIDCASFEWTDFCMCVLFVGRF